MPKHQTTRTVAHSAQKMFELVADVEQYPHFVPLCESLRVPKREERDGKTVLLADMTVAYSFFRDTFTSRVTLDQALAGRCEHCRTRRRACRCRPGS